MDSNSQELDLVVSQQNTTRVHGSAFKAEVALESLQEHKTLSELAQEYQLAPAQFSK